MQLRDIRKDAKCVGAKKSQFQWKMERLRLSRHLP